MRGIRKKALNALPKDPRGPTKHDRNNAVRDGNLHCVGHKPEVEIEIAATLSGFIVYDEA